MEGLVIGRGRQEQFAGKKSEDMSIYFVKGGGFALMANDRC